MDDANFEETVANSSILRLYELRRWCELEMHDSDSTHRKGQKAFLDKLFENELNGLVRETQTQYYE